jgi:hypothetical protein
MRDLPAETEISDHKKALIFAFNAIGDAWVGASGVRKKPLKMHGEEFGAVFWFIQSELYRLHPEARSSDGYVLCPTRMICEALVAHIGGFTIDDVMTTDWPEQSTTGGMLMDFANWHAFHSDDDTDTEES